MQVLGLEAALMSDLKFRFSLCVLVAQSCLTLCHPMDHSPPTWLLCPCSLPCKILKWVAIPFSRGSS